MSDRAKGLYNLQPAPPPLSPLSPHLSLICRRCRSRAERDKDLQHCTMVYETMKHVTKLGMWASSHILTHLARLFYCFAHTLRGAAFRHEGNVLRAVGGCWMLMGKICSHTRIQR